MHDNVGTFVVVLCNFARQTEARCNVVPEHVGVEAGNWTRCGIGDQDAIHLEPDEEDEELEDELTESAELARAGLERSL